MIQALKAKRKSKKGFTLMEMLIVIAIIAILIAIAIPTFGGALNKAKYGADLANVRAWYAEQQIMLMTDDSATPPAAGIDSYKDAKTGGEPLQMSGATVTVGPATGTITADNLTVTYDPNGSAADDAKYPSKTFGN